MTIDRIVLVTKPTEYDQLIIRYASTTQAAFALSSRGASLDAYKKKHDRYVGAIAQIRSQFPKHIPHEVIDHTRVSMFPWGPRDLIIVCGPDGLFVNLAKHIDTQYVIAVNPDRTVVDGKIMIHNPDAVSQLIARVLTDEVSVQQVTLAKVETNDGQTLLAVNDFLVGRADQKAAYYEIDVSGRKERQCSSGVIISTPLGATGWINSIMQGARLLAEADEAEAWPVFQGWGDDTLAFAVREPFKMVDTGTTLLRDYVTADDPLSIRSRMAEGGIICSDGMFDTTIEFTTGVEARFGVSDRKVNFVTR